MLTILLALFACGNDANEDTADTATAVEWPVYSNGACPTLVQGKQSFNVGELSREFNLILPAEPEGKPLVFVWHYLGGTADQMINYMGLESFAPENDFIAVVPRSTDSTYEWDFNDPTDANIDFKLFDDLLSCVGSQYNVDPNRIYATGMSAGGLFTSFLTHHRSQWFAATAPFSGGTTSQHYAVADHPLPVMVTWGGPNDNYGGFDFAGPSAYLSENLRADGHFVMECEHNLGHTLPPETTAMAWQFFLDHPKNITPEPYSSVPESFPDWCRIP